MGIFKKKGVKLGIIVVMAIVVVTGVIVFARNKLSNDYVQADRKRESSIVLKKMDLTKSISATGTVKSGSTKTVSAQLNGIEVKKVNVSAGDNVKEGDKLLEFNTDDLEEVLKEAKENLSDAKKDYNSSVSSAQSKLDDAKSTYNSEKKSLEKKVSDIKKSLEDIKKKIKELKKDIADAENGEEKMAFEEELSRAEESKKSLQNEYETAKNNKKNTNKQNQSGIDNASEALKTAKSNGKKSIKEARKQVKEAKGQLANCKVTATASGIVTAVYVEAGDNYNGGSIVQIDNTSSFKVTASVDEYDISSISKGQKAVVLTAATDEDGLEGKVTFVAPSTVSTGVAETGSMGSGSSSDGYEIEITLDKKDDRLRMGMTARCSIILEEAEDVYAVPYDAVHENKDGKSVIYVEDMGQAGEVQEKAGQREIEVTKGMESDYYVEISGNGLSEGLRVIIPTDSDVSSGNEDKEQEKENTGIPGMGGGMPGGNMQGGGPFGGRGGKGGFNQ